MTNNHSSKQRGALLPRLSLTIALLVASICAWGASVDITPIELDTEYTMKFGNNYYSFVAPESGVCVVIGTQAPMPYYDSNFSQWIDNKDSFVGGKQQREFNVEGGTTYYLAAKVLASDYTFKVTMHDGTSIELVSTSPKQNSTMSISGTGLVSATFSTSVSVGSATFQCGTYAAQLDAHAYGVTASVDVKNSVSYVLQNGIGKEGDEFTVTLKGLCSSVNNDVIYGSDGTLVLRYLLPANPTRLVSESVPASFLSYWTKGDEGGTLKLTFSNDLYTGDDETKKVVATLGYGELEGMDYYFEALNPVVDGNTISIDFSGVMRTPATMTPASDSIYASVSVRVASVYDADGNVCYSSQQGAIGSYSYSIPYEIVSGEVSSDFTPASGADIYDEESIEIFLTGESILKYDGVEFDYTAGGKEQTTVVANSEIERSTEDDGVLLVVAIPDAAKTGRNVTVKLANLVCADGKTRDISALYNLADADNVTLDFKPATVYPDTVPAAAVKQLQSINLSFDENSCIREGYIEEHPIVVYASDGATQVATASISVSAAEVVPNELVVELSETITATDTYRVVIPELLIGNETYAESKYAIGRANPELSLSFKVDASDGIRGIDADSGSAKRNASVYSISGAKEPRASKKHGIYIVDGKKIVR